MGLLNLRDRTTAWMITAQDTLYRAILVLLTVTAVLWMAVFLYATFYYSYMPAVAHQRDVHLQFQSCGREQGLCSYPRATVTLTRRENLLMVGQPYRIVVDLEMPESDANKSAGMFMVCVSLKGRRTVNHGMNLISESCRSGMLQYKSTLHQLMTTLWISPLLIVGSAEEKQVVTFEVWNKFEENPSLPVTEAEIEIQSQHVQVYGASLRIHAHFTGLRYMMFHWPMTSAVIGVTSNAFFLSVIAFLCWYKYFTPKEIVIVHAGYDRGQAKTLEERRAIVKNKMMKEKADKSKLSSSMSQPHHRPESQSLHTSKVSLSSRDDVDDVTSAKSPTMTLPPVETYQVSQIVNTKTDMDFLEFNSQKLALETDEDDVNTAVFECDSGERKKSSSTDGDFEVLSSSSVNVVADDSEEKPRDTKSSSAGSERDMSHGDEESNNDDKENLHEPSDFLMPGSGDRRVRKRTKVSVVTHEK